MTFMSSGQNSQLWKHKASKNILSGSLTCLPRGSAQLLGTSRTPPQAPPTDLKHCGLWARMGPTALQPMTREEFTEAWFNLC